MTTNDRVIKSRENLDYLSDEAIEACCNVLISELGTGDTDIEREAIQKLKTGDYTEAKKLCLMNPTSCYLAAISCMASAYRSPMVADSVLRDAARHTVEVAKIKAEKRIAENFQAIFNK
jgi:hypothetical protein